MPEPKKTFDNLLLIARPAAGKSEIIDYLKNTPLSERPKRFHIGEFIELDDFPMLWAWKEEDSILDEMGHSRLHFDREGNFIHQVFWNVLIERLSLEYEKWTRDHPGFLEESSIILEFSRGSQHGGYREAFHHLSQSIAEKLAILYVDVSWEESFRKNKARYNPDRPDSILEHGLSDAKMKSMYRDDDWHDLAAAHPRGIPIRGVEVPFAVLDNEDDLTSRGGAALGERLEEVLGRLFNQYITTRPDRS